MLEFRAYLNEGGRVLLTGDNAGQQYTPERRAISCYDPKGEIACAPLPCPDIDPRRCLLLRGSGDGTNDVLQYTFGGYLAVRFDGLDENGNTFGVVGTDDPFNGLSWTLNGPDSADNQANTSSFIATSGILPPDEFKQFQSWPSARWDKPGGPFSPHTGDQYVYSQIADVSYKRLTREVAVPAGGGSLTFWTSYDTEAEWDHLFVEAHTPGQDDWTTLPDANGHTTTAPGQSCAARRWVALHPQLAHYQTLGRQHDLHVDRHHRYVECRERQLGRLAAVEHRPVRLCRARRWRSRSPTPATGPPRAWVSSSTTSYCRTARAPRSRALTRVVGRSRIRLRAAPPTANNWAITDASGFPVGNAIATPHTPAVRVRHSRGSRPPPNGTR